MDARMEAIEATMMMQSGALSSAKEQAEAHREELTRMMRDLHDTVVQTAEAERWGATVKVWWSCGGWHGLDSTGM